ncbi:MAG: lipid II flippase Amj family protein [Bacillota bacterium]
MTRLLVVAGLTALIHFINTLIYGVRLAGVRTQRLALAISLFNVIFLVASTANTIQAPLLSSLVEKAINAGLGTVTRPAEVSRLVESDFYRGHLAILQGDIRLVIAAATLGTVLGALLIPAFVQVFSRAILLFEEAGSVPRLLATVFFSPRRVFGFARRVRVARVEVLRRATRRSPPIPKAFLLLNIVVTGVYTTGVLSALYAGALFPLYRSTATLLAPLVNGVATVLAATVVDPTAAMITDQALRGVRGEEDVKLMVLYLALTRFLGTLLAQVLFLPAAEAIRLAAQLIV